VAIYRGCIDTATGVVDGGGKFATGINNTSGTVGEHLPAVSLILVVHNDLQIFTQIFKKFEMILQ
jgi:hypothetical protein